MNVSEKKYTEFIGVKLTKEQYNLLCKTLNVKKKESFSEKLREFILSHLPWDLKLEYRLTQDEGITGVYLYKAGTEELVNTLFYESKEDAMEYVNSVGATEKESYL